MIFHFKYLLFMLPSSCFLFNIVKKRGWKIKVHFDSSFYTTINVSFVCYSVFFFLVFFLSFIFKLRLIFLYVLIFLLLLLFICFLFFVFLLLQMKIEFLNEKYDFVSSSYIVTRTNICISVYVICF